MESKELTELKIYKGGEFAGLLRRRADGGAEFVYDKAYLSNSDTRDLCLTMKKRPEPFIQHGANLHPYFAGLLPEGLRLKFLLQKIKTSPDDLFSIFAAIGPDCIGDVYAESNQPKTLADGAALPYWNEFNFYDYFLSSIKDSPMSDPSEFAGVQEKISASMISLPFSIQNKGSYILKFNPRDKQNLVYNEWICLYLAELCGLKVNEYKLIEDRDGDLGLLVKRFDRMIKDRKLIRIHQEDMCQALSLFPAEKYRIPLKDIFNGIQKHTTAPLIESYHLLKLVVFSYLIGNGDLHAKNISVYESPVDSRIGLTPAYDLICTLLYGDHKMALKMDAKDANFKRIDFINFATRFELKKLAAESAIDDVLEKFYQYHHILFSIPMSENRMNFLAHELSLRINSLSGN